MEVFFAKMGVTNLRFKPAYNPYTEVRLPPHPSHTRNTTDSCLVAVSRDLLLARRIEAMGRDWEFRNVPTGDVGTDGITR